MSTAWFEKQEDNGKMDRKVQTTGHMVEFLLTALNDDELQSPQMLRSISFCPIRSGKSEGMMAGRTQRARASRAGDVLSTSLWPP